MHRRRVVAIKEGVGKTAAAMLGTLAEVQVESIQNKKKEGSFEVEGAEGVW